VLRYTDSGRRKREVWEHTWAQQRREDVIDAAVAKEFADRSADEIAAAQKRRKHAAVGDTPVRPEDFKDTTYWGLCGSLDVPKERFVRFPFLERANDPAALLMLWAGYDARQRTLALATHLYELQSREVRAPSGSRQRSRDSTTSCLG
jgi:uncharacterized protein YbaA (DUF1428 family)